MKIFPRQEEKKNARRNEFCFQLFLGFVFKRIDKKKNRLFLFVQSLKIDTFLTLTKFSFLSNFEKCVDATNHRVERPSTNFFGLFFDDRWTLMKRAKHRPTQFRCDFSMNQSVVMHSVSASMFDTSTNQIMKIDHLKIIVFRQLRRKSVHLQDSKSKIIFLLILRFVENSSSIAGKRHLNKRTDRDLFFR